MSVYTQGLAYQLDPVTFRNAAFPQLPESTPSSTNDISYDSGTGAITKPVGYTSGLLYNSTFGINLDDYAVYMEFWMDSQASSDSATLRPFHFLNVTGLSLLGGTLITKDFLYEGPDTNLYSSPTTYGSAGSPFTTSSGNCNYHFKFTTPFSHPAQSLIESDTPIWGAWHSILLTVKTLNSTGVKIYLDGTLKTAIDVPNANTFSPTKLEVFPWSARGLSGTGSNYLRVLNIYSTASQMDYSSMATVSPSPGILPTSYTSGTSRLRKYFANSGVPTPTTNVALTGLEARFDKHRFYYPRPNKMHFTLRGGKNG